MSGQRELHYYDRRHRNVQGYFIIDGGRVRRKLASFADLGLDETGVLLDGSKRAKGRLSSFLHARHLEMQRELERGEKERKTKGRSVRGLLQEWLDLAQTTQSRRNRELYIRASNTFLEIIGDRPVNEITLRQTDKMIVALRERGLNPGGVNVYLKSLNAFFTWAKERKEISEPLRIKLLKTPQKIPQTLPPSDIKKLASRIIHLWREAPDQRKRHFYGLHIRYLLIATGTGMRRSEIVFLPWKQVFLDRAEILVLMQPRFAVKERREKRIPMPDYLVGFLSIQRQEFPLETWVMDDGKGQLAYHDPNAFTRAFGRHFKALGLEGRGVPATHGFRRYYATIMRNLIGADIATIAENLGHRSITTTMRYFGDREALQKESARMLNAKEPAELARIWRGEKSGK